MAARRSATTSWSCPMLCGSLDRAGPARSCGCRRKEAGLPPPTNWRNFAAVPVGDDDNPGPILAHRAYYGSLDAAKALHETLLPGYLVELRQWLDSLCMATVRPPYAPAHQAQGETLARAWLLAILRAYEATHDR